MVPGSNQAMISALETRDSENTILLFDFADALKVNPRWLLTGDGDSWLDGAGARRLRVARLPVKDAPKS